MPAGITYYIIHPAGDSPELRTMAHDWQARVAHHRMFTDERLRSYLSNSSLQVIGYRALRDLMRKG